MTIAADKIHLSEEEKLFAGTNKTNDNFLPVSGKPSRNC